MNQRTVVFLASAVGMGGVEFSTVYLAQRLDPSRWRVVIVCPGEGDLTNLCRSQGLSVHVLRRPAPKYTSIQLGFGPRLPNPFAWVWNLGLMLHAAKDLVHLLRNSPPDLIVTKGMFAHFYGGLSARWLHVPCIWHLQDFVSERFWGIYRRIFGLAAGRLPYAIVADGESIVRQLPGAAQQRAEVIYNGVDINLFRPSANGANIRVQLGVSTDALVIGHVARMSQWKGQHYLLEAFGRVAHEYPRAVLLFVGSPLFASSAYERYLRRRTEELQLTKRVVFVGHRNDLPKVLPAMDVFAYSSIEKDTSPLALLSAMAAGLPVVAFGIDGIREVIDDGDSGILVPVEDIESFAQTLKQVLADVALRKRLAVNARRQVENKFNLDHHAVSMEKVFVRTLASRARTADSFPIGARGDYLDS